MKELTIILIVLLLILIMFKNNKECLATRPKDDMIPKMTRDIIENEGMFTGGIELVRKKLPWVDPVLYEDVRHLAIKKNINADTVSRLLR